jgi:hypothetical protein
MLTEEKVKELTLDAEQRFLEYILRAKKIGPEALIVYHVDGARAEIEVEILYKILEKPAPVWQTVVDTERFGTP